MQCWQEDMCFWKTFLVLERQPQLLALCRLMGMDFNRIQFTPDVVPSDVTGFTMYEKQTGRFIYRPGAVMCNMLLADEINRTSSKTQAALLEVMEEGKVTVDNETHPVPQPFVVIATENPTGSSGTRCCRNPSWTDL